LARGAFTGHEYSVVYEGTGGSFVGIHVKRNDVNVSPPAGSNCTSYFGGGSNAVYQTQWALLTANALNWEELGTADQCSGFDYMFWGYGLSGVWHPLGEAATPGGAGQHVFQILMSNGTNWNYSVDGTIIGSDTWTHAVEVSAGLESYADMLISAQVYVELEYATAVGGGWHLWAGKDAQDVGPDMCGRWNTASDWRAAEHGTC
jgi:hypothetical protein